MWVLGNTNIPPCKPRTHMKNKQINEKKKN